jgi:hypothetical protein
MERSGWTVSSLVGGLMLSLLAIAPGPDRADQTPDVAPFLARARSHLAEREYRASENAEGLQAPNRAHDLRTNFDATGIRVHDRTAADHGELLRLALPGMGRGASLAPVAPGDEVVARENRVEIERPGLVEWFVNGPEGLEQGFDLSERPAGHGKLRLELSLSGARAKPSGEALIFETDSERLLGVAAEDPFAIPALEGQLHLGLAEQLALFADRGDEEPAPPQRVQDAGEVGDLPGRARDC